MSGMPCCCTACGMGACMPEVAEVTARIASCSFMSALVSRFMGGAAVPELGGAPITLDRGGGGGGGGRCGADEGEGAAAAPRSSSEHEDGARNLHLRSELAA